MKDVMKIMTSSGFFTEIDRYFASFMAELAGKEGVELVLASLLLSRSTGRGDICLDIPSIAGRNLSAVYPDFEDDILLPPLEEWLDALQKTGVAGKPGEYRPLIIDEGGRLYLHRYWNYEKNVADSIKMRLASGPLDFDHALLRDGLARLFPDAGGETDWQLVAAINAVVRRFCVISGGPGTGKTSTVVRILVLLLEQAFSKGATPSIALCAPTGKAAARLKESIKLAREGLECAEDIKQMIPDESFTIHRLLGPVHGSCYFRHNNDNPLIHDIVVVDESSMADLALLSKLLGAVSIESRLILIGDKDQLSSVEAGAALGDICDTGNQHHHSKNFVTVIKKISTVTELKSAAEPRIADSLVILTKSYRFGDESGIGIFSGAIRDGRSGEAIEILKSGKYPDIRLIENRGQDLIKDALDSFIENGYGSYLQAGAIEESFGRFSRYAVLCVLRRGPFGVSQINAGMEKLLQSRGLIEPATRWYNGRPVMINRNDYHLKLYNGDVGIIINDIESDNRPRFFHQTPDGTLRKILPLKLPEHETVHAMTVHKSQGSEFDNVLLVLPDRENPVLSRELLYTAVTRARREVWILGSADILRMMIDRPTVRKSGLRDELWEPVDG